MNQLSTPGQLPIVLGIDLVIDRHKALRNRVGANARAILMRIDPSVDLVFLTEVTLPNTLPCLRRLIQPNTTGVWLLSAYLECLLPSDGAGKNASSLAVLENGSCFLMADDQKIPIATFSNAEMNSTHIDMQLLQPTNLLDFLLAETFTVEISGVNRRHLTHPLALSLALQFGTQPPACSYGTKRPHQHSYAAT